MRERKQERRGGIETSMRSRSSAERRWGSRNAVVALKLPNWGVVWKLEFRKQERRGGIETRLRCGKDNSRQMEAGTPWWH